MVCGEERRKVVARTHKFPSSRSSATCALLCGVRMRACAQTSAGNEMPTRGNRYISKVDLCICILILFRRVI